MALLLSLDPAAVAGQGFSGRVTLRGTGEPVVGALVSVLRPDESRVRGVLTDEDGAFSVDVPLGDYRLKAERIGLATETTELLELRTFAGLTVTIEMSPRPVEIEGIMVDSRVRSCRVDREQADRIQRWWSEIRTALDVSAALQREEFGRFLVERFRREWDEDLDDVLGENRVHEVSTSTRPFVSAPAEELVEEGFVRGPYGPDRLYFGPDADVILSSAFLTQHCFSLVDDGDRDRQVGLHFEPIDGRDVPDIEGTLWVDTTSAELQDLDFRYVNIEGPEGDDAGGHIDFRYLATGAWIVSEWFIRTPETGLRGRPPRLVTTGFFDGGGAVVPLFVPDTLADTGTVRGVVKDRMRGGEFAGAVVTLLDTGRQVTTDPEGRFWFFEVPEGPHHITFSHPELDAWGLGTGYRRIDVRAGESTSTELSVPDFRQVARSLCLSRGDEAETVVAGRVLGPEGDAVFGQYLQIAFDQLEGASGRRISTGLSTDEEGRFAVCSVPEGVEATLQLRSGREWVDVTRLEPERHRVTYREIRLGG